MHKNKQANKKQSTNQVTIQTNKQTKNKNTIVVHIFGRYAPAEYGYFD